MSKRRVSNYTEFKESLADATAPAETRLNYLMNFNHVNKDQMGAMEIFGPRSNNEIQRMNDEIFDEEPEGEEHGYENELETGLDDFNYPEDQEDGLDINSDEEVIPRMHSYPYGFGTPPLPTYKVGSTVQSKTGSPHLTFEQYITNENEEFKWSGVTIKGKKLDERFVEKITSKVNPGSKILDVGYGDGTEMEYLTQQGYSVYGTEVKEDYKDNLKNSHHVTHDMRDPFPFKDNFFDLVYCRLSLHYFDKNELLGIFEELSRIVRSGGYLFFTCKTSDGGYSSGKKFYSLEEWVEMAEYSGFQSFESKNMSGELYGKPSQWVEVYTKLN